MIDTPAALYSKLLSDFALSEHVVCDLHKPCNKVTGHRCSTALMHKIIDFDKVKTEYYRGKSELPKASTDGFTYKGQLYCFVELKGWADFLNFNTDSSTLESKIREQAEKYDLGKKLADSMFVCKCVSENENIFEDATVVFILVTDIDVSGDGPREFYADLMSLSETSSKWEDICNRELGDKLLSLPSNIKTYYVKCQKFDETISKIADL